MCDVAETVEAAQQAGSESEDSGREQDAHDEGEHHILTRIFGEKDHRADEAQELESLHV